MTIGSKLQKILRRIKNTLKYAHARYAHATHRHSTLNFSRQLTLQFQHPTERNVWTEIPTLSDEEIAQAIAGKIILFGHTTYIQKNNPRWHHDLRLPPEQNPDFSKTFSFDIRLKEFSSSNPALFGFDIKYPWERSRLQYLLPLGKTFKNNQERIELFTFFKEELESWIAHNSYLTGPCWMNAMEVAIRGTNMLWLLSFFYTEHNAKTHESFWNLYLTVLLQHAQFIAKYWEDYDVPNNHYLLNLTGAWYLARFFALHQIFPFGNLDTLWTNVCTGFDQQLNNDGTLYEHSTAYHSLVIQSLQHLDQQNVLSPYTMPAALKEKLRKGTQFLADCYPQDALRPILIGDDDSGSLVWQIIPQLIPDAFCDKKTEEAPIIRYYPDFGIVFFINKTWHVSLRTKSFQPRTPTGHAHADVLGITLYHEKTPILIDPGTGTYTANTTTRNILRSWAQHSTLWQPDHLRFDFSRLFSLRGTHIPEIQPIFSGPPLAPVATAQYSNGKVLFTRSVKLDIVHKAVLITDSASSTISLANFPIKTTLNLAPKIKIMPHGPTFYDLECGNHTVTLRCKKTSFSVRDGLFSLHYGKAIPTKQLVAEGVTPYHDCLELRIKT